MFPSGRQFSLYKIIKSRHYPLAKSPLLFQGDRSRLLRLPLVRRCFVLTSCIRFRTPYFANRTASVSLLTFVRRTHPVQHILRALPDWHGGIITAFRFLADFLACLLSGRSQGLPCSSFRTQPTGFFIKEPDATISTFVM